VVSINNNNNNNNNNNSQHSLKYNLNVRIVKVCHNTHI